MTNTKIPEPLAGSGIFVVTTAGKGYWDQGIVKRCSTDFKDLKDKNVEQDKQVLL
jgi:hypothetical protein